MVGVAREHIIGPMPDQSPYPPDPYYGGGQYPGQQRRGPSWLLIAGVVMLAIAIGIGGFSIYDNRNVLFPPAVPTPVTTPHPTYNAVAQATASTPPPSSSPSPSSQPSSSQTASPAPTEATPATLFAEMAVAPNVSFHADVVVTLTAQADGKMRIALSMDQSGNDLDGTMVIRYRHQKATVRVIVKDGTYYAKLNRTAWQVEPSPSTSDYGTLLAPGSAQNVQDLGVESRDGKQLDHLKVDFNETPEVTNVLSQMGCDGFDYVADFWVKADGTPVSAALDYSCVISGESMSVHATYEFSKFGQPIVIQAPKKFR